MAHIFYIINATNKLLSYFFNEFAQYQVFILLNYFNNFAFFYLPYICR